MKLHVSIVSLVILSWAHATRATVVDTDIARADIKILGQDLDVQPIRTGAGGWSAVGDFNGDGLPDLATSGTFQPVAPTVSILFGRASWPSVVNLNAAPPDVVIWETPLYGARAGFGWGPPLGDGGWRTILASGDLTGDGIDDLVMSAGQEPDRGLILIVPGRTTWPPSIALHGPSWTPAVVGPAPAGGIDDMFATSIHVTDFNGDGAADLLAGAVQAPLALGGTKGAGRIYAIPGPIADERYDVESLACLVVESTSGIDPLGNDAKWQLGRVLESGQLSPRIQHGIVLGQEQDYPLGRTVLLDGTRLEPMANVDGSDALVLQVQGRSPFHAFGHAVALGDTDCSGWGDLLVNSFSSLRPDGEGKARADLFRDVARSGGGPVIPDLMVQGRRNRSGAGTGMIWGVDLADLNGDAFDDMIFFEPYTEVFPGTETTGAVTIVWNRPDVPPALDLEVDTQFQLTLVGPGTGATGRVYGLPMKAADLDGDGRTDLLVGAKQQHQPTFRPDGILDVFTRNLHVTTVVAEGGADQIVDIPRGGGICSMSITLDASGSSDRDGHPLRHRWYEGAALLAEGTVVTVVLDAGEHCIRLFSTSAGGWAQDRIRITVREGDPPDIQLLSVTPQSLWPPNHRLREVHVFGEAWDACTPPGELRWTLRTVASNEPQDGLGDGTTAPDIAGWEIGTADFDGELRAERSGTGAGREYTLTYEVADSAGNVTTTTLVVPVAHDRGGGGRARGRIRR